MSRLSRIQSLYPPGVIAGEALPSEQPMEGNEPRDLYPEERDAVARAIGRRKREYAAGRRLARHGMEALGIAPQPLLNGPDRAPLWPKGVVGSISHTRDYCVVVIGAEGAFESLGIDVEMDEAVEPPLWNRICTETERDFVESFKAEERGRLVRLIFSAKECFYKCQYPLTKEYLGFHDVELTLDLSGQRFRVVFGRDVGSRFAAGSELEGKFARLGAHVISAMTLAVGR